MLDILQLHKPEDNRDARCWILAKGENLRNEINYLKCELLKIISKEDLINYLAKNADVTLRIDFDDLSVKEWLGQIENLRVKRELPFKKMMKLTGTAGNHWSKIQRGESLPSCKKLERIINILDLKVEKVCSKSDFCLRSIDAIIKSLNSDWIPLIIISGILDLYREKFNISEEKFNDLKNKIIDSIELLRVKQNNSNPIKCVKNVNKTLAKIIGAFAADGNYSPPDMIRWEDEYKEQLKILSKWINTSFGIKLKIKPSKRNRKSFETKFRNKIIGRYFEMFFDFQPVDKRYTVDEPKLIKLQLLKIRKAFAAGAIMFDGSVNSSGDVSFSSASKKFRDSVSEILLNDGIILSLPKKPFKSIWNFTTSRKLDENQLQKLSSYFENGSLKRKVIDFYLGKFKISNINDLRSLFPKIKSKLHPSDLARIVIDFKKFDIYQLMEQTNLSRQMLLRYLRILEGSGIIKSEIYKHKRIYSPNNCLINDDLLNSIKSE